MRFLSGTLSIVQLSMLSLSPLEEPASVEHSVPKIESREEFVSSSANSSKGWNAVLKDSLLRVSWLSWASSSSRMVSSRISSRRLLKRGDFGIKCIDFFDCSAESSFIILVRLVKFNFTFGLKVGFG